MAKPKILYIEDDPANIRLVERVLDLAGYEVYTAQTGLRGVDLARQMTPDLILTDINLPDLKGHELAAILRSQPEFESVPIVALTALDYGEHREMALAAGINGYLAKPLNATRLREQVTYYLKGGSDAIDADRLNAGKSRYIRETVTHLEQRIRQLEDANESLYRLDRMKQAFIQITAHELRTPLTLVYGYVRLLEDFPVLQNVIRQDESVRTLIEGLVESIERMHTVVNEILIISRILTQQIVLNITQVEPALLIERILRDFDEAVQERRLSIRFDREQLPQVMRADGDMLRLAFANLIGNAIKYTPDGGTIGIVGRAQDGLVHLTVTDSGIGIDPDDQPYIFDQFHTIADAELHSTSKTAFGGGGLGLGLTICKGIVEAHGGDISVNSPGYDPEACPGSTFTITLPVSIVRHTGDTQSLSDPK